MKLQLTKLEKSWILYDVANSAFILLVATLLPIYFDVLAAKGNLSQSDYLAYWGYAGSVATILVAVIGPICGTLADQRGFKKPLFVLSMILGVAGCAMLGVAWNWLSFLVIFVIAKVGYSSSLVFYDSMLPEISDHENVDRVSTLGYALGYIGSCSRETEKYGGTCNLVTPTAGATPEDVANTVALLASEEGRPFHGQVIKVIKDWTKA